MLRQGRSPPPEHPSIVPARHLWVSWSYTTYATVLPAINQYYYLFFLLSERNGPFFAERVYNRLKSDSPFSCHDWINSREVQIR